eukprot:gene32141-38878_t
MASFQGREVAVIPGEDLGHPVGVVAVVGGMAEVVVVMEDEVEEGEKIMEAGVEGEGILRAEEEGGEAATLEGAQGAEETLVEAGEEGEEEILVGEGEAEAKGAILTWVSCPKSWRCSHPPQADRAQRPSLVGAHTNQIPPLEAWRLDRPVGANLPSLLTNHYRLSPEHFPAAIHHYHVRIFRLFAEGKGGGRGEGKAGSEAEDYAIKGDQAVCIGVVLRLLQKRPAWANIGTAYNGRAALFTTASLFAAGESPLIEEVGLVPPSSDQESELVRFQVHISQVGVMSLPPADRPAEWTCLSGATMMALEVGMLSPVRYQCRETNPAWFLAGANKIFAGGEEGNFDLSPPLVARRGYSASLRCTLGGIMFIADMTVNAFMRTGSLMDLMAQYLGMNTRTFMEGTATQPVRGGKGESGPNIRDLESAFKGIKVKLMHIMQTKKFVAIGPPASSRESEFDFEDPGAAAEGKGGQGGKAAGPIRITVADYFKYMRNKDGRYPALRYPNAWTINVGSQKRPILVPLELLVVPGGQARGGKVTPEMTAQIIRHAAVKPDERFSYITEGDNLLPLLLNDKTSAAFGMAGMSLSPVQSAAYLLPPAKLLYGGNRTMEPGLAGQWSIDRPQQKVLVPPPQPSKSGDYPYGVLLVGRGPPRGDWKGAMTTLLGEIERDMSSAGVKMRRAVDPQFANPDVPPIKDKLLYLKPLVRIVLVLMVDPACYPLVKFAGDGEGIVTQCIKWKNVERIPRGFGFNLLLKINTKLGGTSHCLASRAPSNTTAPAGIFQNPPASICWVLDRPT